MVVSALALAACETTQPDRVTARNASVTFAATGKLGHPQLLRSVAGHEQSAGRNGGRVSGCRPICYEQRTATQARAMPWHYSVIITVIRAGTTIETLLFSNDGVPGTTSLPEQPDEIDPFSAMTDYDPTQPSAPFRPPEGAIVYVERQRRVMGKPDLYCRHSRRAAPPARPIWVSPTSWEGRHRLISSLNAGDTVIVRARKQLFSQSPGYLPTERDSGAHAGRRSRPRSAIGGVPVAPNGTTASSGEDGSEPLVLLHGPIAANPSRKASMRLTKWPAALLCGIALVLPVHAQEEPAPKEPAPEPETQTEEEVPPTPPPPAAPKGVEEPELHRWGGWTLSVAAWSPSLIGADEEIASASQNGTPIPIMQGSDPNHSRPSRPSITSRRTSARSPANTTRWGRTTTQVTFCPAISSSKSLEPIRSRSARSTTGTPMESRHMPCAARTTFASSSRKKPSTPDGPAPHGGPGSET